MKIGILTHHYVSNYGAFLQAWSLCAAVSDMFPEADVRIVNYVNAKHRFINSCGCLRFNPARESLGAWFQKSTLPRVFKRAVNARLPLTERVRGASDINALKLDALIVGSDEVWNFLDRKSADSLKFGYGIDCPKLIAYAPSVGKSTDVSKMTDEMKTGLRGFTSISARDTNTASVVKAVLNAECEIVPDPTFLKRPYGDYTQRAVLLTERPFALFYHARLSNEKRAEIRRIASEKGLRLLGAGEYDSIYDDVCVNLSPFEWVSLFECARFVITGTFHGCVFSVLNDKPVYCCPNNETRLAKLDAFTRSLGMSDCVIDPETTPAAAFFAPPRVSESAKAEISRLESVGLRYLKSALGD